MSATVDDIERICEIMTRYGVTRVRLGPVEIELPRVSANAPAPAGVARPSLSVGDAFIPTTMDELRAAVLPAPAEEVG